MKSTLSKMIVAAGVLASTGAQAANSVASLQMFQGKVLVNHGQGFSDAVVNTGLNVGDQIMVGNGGSALISFDGCTVNLAKATVFKVGKTAPCAKGQKLAQVGDVFIAPAATEGFASDSTPVFVLGAWAAAGAGLILFTSRQCNGVSAC